MACTKIPFTTKLTREFTSQHLFSSTLPLSLRGEKETEFQIKHLVVATHRFIQMLLWSTWYHQTSREINVSFQAGALQYASFPFIYLFFFKKTLSIKENITGHYLEYIGFNVMKYKRSIPCVERKMDQDICQIYLQTSHLTFSISPGDKLHFKIWHSILQINKINSNSR